jgi:hypothetical protein
MFYSGNFCSTIRPLATVICEHPAVPYLNLDSERGNQFILHILQLIASRGSGRNDRLPKGPFAFCLKIDTKEGAQFSADLSVY